MNNVFFHHSNFLLAKLRPDFRDNYESSEIENDTILHILRLRIKSMSATSGPPIGPVLGQYGIPISKFCSEFNDRSQIFNDNVHVFVTLYHYADGSFSSDMSAPTVSMCIKKIIRSGKCYGTHLRLRNGVLTPYMLYEAVVYKLSKTDDFERACITSLYKCCLGTLRSMGIGVYIDDNDKITVVDQHDSYKI